MSTRLYPYLFIAAAALALSSTASGQVEVQLRVRQQPGWDVNAREGHCQVRVWVDNRAEVRMRGDTIFVRTLEGSKGRDEGSECSQPIPFNSVRDFKIQQTAGRNRIALSQAPSRMNNNTALIAIEDPQGGGDNYAFEVSWRSEPDVAAAPAPFFDDVRSCQETVRQRFQGQNGRGAYIDFETFADRKSQDEGQHRGRQNQGRSRGQESIQGRGIARNSVESRELTYSCFVDARQNQVLSGAYQYTGSSQRSNNRAGDRGLLR